jgi:hypothetical protein
MKEQVSNLCNENKTFTSPFPRTKSNCELIKSSTLLESTISSMENKICLNVPASITKSYMKRNTFYFDLKKHKNNFNNKASQNIQTKSKKITFNSTCVFSKDHLDSMMKYTKKNSATLDKHLKHKPEMMIEKEKVNVMPKLKNKYKLCAEFSECQTRNLIENILNTKLCLKNDNNNYGIVPE